MVIRHLGGKSINSLRRKQKATLTNLDDTPWLENLSNVSKHIGKLGWVEPKEEKSSRDNVELGIPFLGQWIEDTLDAQIEALSIGGEHAIAEIDAGKFTVGKAFADVTQPSRIAAAQVEDGMWSPAIEVVLDLLGEETSDGASGDLVLERESLAFR
jgi:hypothetical protein